LQQLSYNSEAQLGFSFCLVLWSGHWAETLGGGNFSGGFNGSTKGLSSHCGEIFLQQKS